VSAIFTKLQVRDRAAAVAKARDAGLGSGSPAQTGDRINRPRAFSSALCPTSESNTPERGLHDQSPEQLSMWLAPEVRPLSLTGPSAVAIGWRWWRRGLTVHFRELAALMPVIR
jgi:hypothetical protein